MVNNLYFPSISILMVLSLWGWNQSVNKSSDIKVHSLSDSTMVFVNGGTFLMGSNEGREHEHPVHKVTLSDYYISRYEVTVVEYLAFVEATNSHHPEWLEPGSKYNIHTGTYDNYKRSGDALTNPNHPITGVSWRDANAYCKWLSNKEELSYRLPTEAEWEFAARGGNANRGYLNPGSDTLDHVAWYRDNSGNHTHPIGQKAPNELGLYDMAGNVCEWVADLYGMYSAEAQTNPTGPNKGNGIIFRGGGFSNWEDQCTVSFRNDNSMMARLKGIGFRVARDVDEP